VPRLAGGGDDTGDRSSHRVDVHSHPENRPLSPETVSQAGAGALLVAVAVSELWLAFWAAGWWHRSAASALALAGAVLLARAVAAALGRRGRSERLVPAEKPAPVETVPAGLVRAEWARG
jgi:hypothetical protein